MTKRWKEETPEERQERIARISRQIKEYQEQFWSVERTMRSPQQMRPH